MAVGCSGPGRVIYEQPEDEGGSVSDVESSTSGMSASGIEPTSGLATTSMTGEETFGEPVCGNGQVEGDEQCDGEQWNGPTCESLGYGGGGRACVECRLDVSMCRPPPGMVDVPGGVFEMGSERFSNAEPVRRVLVDRFWMDETEVTVARYSACVDEGACAEPGTVTGCNWMVEGREDHPINCVTWFDAAAYCAWVDQRLPTEAEWEKAARGVDARPYPWGSSPEPSCSHVVMYDGTQGRFGLGCGMESTMTTASMPLGTSPYGAQDMAGNVWEWVADWYAPSYDVRDTDNPTGPAQRDSRVLRSGSWYNGSPSVFHAAHRNSAEPTDSFHGVGFRCSMTPPTGP